LMIKGENTRPAKTIARTILATIPWFTWAAHS
jgi:hypothetical protein